MVRIKGILSLFTVCIAIIGYLPLLPYLEPFARWFFPAALLVGLYLQQRKGPLSARTLTPLALALFLYFGVGFTMDRLILITADLLVVFLGIRMLGEWSGRNCLQVFALSLFCLADSSLYNLSALFLVYLLLLLCLLAVSLVILTFHAHDAELRLPHGELRKVLGVSCLLPVFSLPVLLVLFVLLPRTQYPLWNLLNRAAPRSAGFSDKVDPGGSASVAQVKSVVLRAVCGKLPEQRLYWRGIVLNGFRGSAWVRFPAPPERSLWGPRERGVPQEIYPEPSANPYLLALNIPRSFSGQRSRESVDAVFRLRHPLDTRIKYRAESTLSGAIPVEGGIDRDFYLRLPASVSARVRAKGRELARPGLDARQKLQLLESFFRAQRLVYATSELPTGTDSLDDFLFAKKRGNCEFFASSLAILLRLAGVPARLVGGYRGGNYNEVGGYYLVTEDMAHVWVEVYLEGEGWLTVDPTAWSLGFSPDQGAARRLSLYADAVGFYWNKAVIGYDLDRQLALVRAAGAKAHDLRPPVDWWRGPAWFFLTFAPLAALLALLRRRRSKEEKVLGRFLRVVRRRYPAAEVGQDGLFQLAARIDDPLLREFAEVYGGAIYRDRRLQSEELTRLETLIGRLKQQLS